MIRYGEVGSSLFVGYVLEPRLVLDMIGGRAGYRGCLQDGLNEGHREEYYRVEDRRFPEGEGFREIRAQRLKTRLSYGV